MDIVSYQIEMQEYFRKKIEIIYIVRNTFFV